MPNGEQPPPPIRWSGSRTLNRTLWWDETVRSTTSALWALAGTRCPISWSWMHRYVCAMIGCSRRVRPVLLQVLKVKEGISNGPLTFFHICTVCGIKKVRGVMINHYWSQSVTPLLLKNTYLPFFLYIIFTARMSVVFNAGFKLKKSDVHILAAWNTKIEAILFKKANGKASYLHNDTH